MVVKLDSKMVAQRVARSAEMMAAMALVSVRTMEAGMGIKSAFGHCIRRDESSPTGNILWILRSSYYFFTGRYR